MAKLAERLPENVPGDFSVDRTCIDYSFEWVLPGHGTWHRAESPAQMRRELEACIAWMKSAA